MAWHRRWRPIPKLAWIYSVVFGVILLCAYLTLPRSDASSSFPILQGEGSPARSHGLNLKTVVVDEHHEVLPHWYDVAKKTGLSKFSLIHIDGHSDLATPYYVDNMFNWPKNRNQITPFMQSNDVFVVGAMATGLVSSYVWVWPEWTRESVGEDFGDYIEGYMDIGYFDYMDEEDGEMERGACTMFYKMRTSGQTMSSNRLMPADDEFETLPRLDDSKKRDIKCNYKRKSVEFQVMSMTYALKNGLHPHTESEQAKPRPTILDVDEDYWGCERGSDIIEKNGIRWRDVELMNDFLRDAIVPKTVDDETNLNSILQSLMTYSTYDYRSKKCYLDPHSLEELEKSGRLKWSYTSPLTSLIKIIKKMTIKQQQIIREVGFCLDTSPDTAHVVLGEPNFLRVCTGNSEPGSNNSVFYTPDVTSINTDMQEVASLLLYKIDFEKEYDLRLITVARSFRDKYTPMVFQSMIEKGVLATLKQVFGSRHVAYDENNLKIYDN